MKTTKYTINKPSIFHKTKLNKWVVLTKLKKQTPRVIIIYKMQMVAHLKYILYSILCKNIILVLPMSTNGKHMVWILHQ